MSESQRKWDRNAAASSKDESEYSFEFQYTKVDDWLQDWLLPIAGPRSTSGRKYWCKQWWRHPDVTTRLTALWLSWENAYALKISDMTGEDPLEGLSNQSHWWAYHFAAHKEHLFGSESSMTGCGSRHVELAPPLDAEDLPPSLRVVS